MSWTKIGNSADPVKFHNPFENRLGRPYSPFQGLIAWLLSIVFYSSRYRERKTGILDVPPFRLSVFLAEYFI